MKALALGTIAALLLATTAQAQQVQPPAPTPGVDNVYTDVYVNNSPTLATQNVNTNSLIDGDVVNTSITSTVSYDDVIAGQINGDFYVDVNHINSQSTALQTVAKAGGAINGDVTNTAVGAAVSVDFD